jgi:hypothetical protein
MNGNGSDYECQVSEQEIRAALAALRSAPRGFRLPPASSAPARSPRALPWILVGIVLGAILTLATTKHYQSDPISQNQTQGPRSLAALPASTPVLRALPVSMPALRYEIGSRQVLTLPDGTILPTVFKGYLSEVSKLPLHGSEIGDMYGVADGLWVLSTIRILAEWVG